MISISGKGPELSIVIVNFNTREHLVRCLRSLKTFPPGVFHEIIVADNGSTDGSANAVRNMFPDCLLLEASINEGYGVAVNKAVPHARGRWLMFLNPDVETTRGAIQTLLEFSDDHPSAGIVAPRLYYPDGRLQPTANHFASTGRLLFESFRLHRLLPQNTRARLLLGTYFSHDVTLRVPWICGACHLLPRYVWETVGPLTEVTFCGGDDYDYCRRASFHGFEVWLCAEAAMVHHASVAIRGRWSAVTVEELIKHNLYVVFRLHWPEWRVRMYALAECFCWSLELIRAAIAGLFRRSGRNELPPLWNRLRIVYSFFAGRQVPIRRFEPPTKQVPK